LSGIPAVIESDLPNYSSMHFLLTNDDGIDALGLAALEHAIRLLPGATITVFAPAVEQSQYGHRVTTREQFSVTQQAERRYSVEGTPADCVRVALYAFAIRPDFVISGVNAGGNMGQDLHISGTVAAAREAAFHGLPSAAFSHYLIRDLALDWPRAAEWTRGILPELLAQPLGDGEFWNVNYPHFPAGRIEMPGRIPCHPCRAPLNVSYETTRLGQSVTGHRYTASYAARPVEEDSDVAVCFGGQIAVSRLRI
jgi:5'-nucleotidase